MALSEGTQIALIGAIVTGGIVPTWLAWWNSRVARKQLKPNGGTSIVDKLTRIESKVDHAKQAAEINTQRIATIRASQEYRNEKLDELETRLDEHIIYMREVHDRTGKPERRNK